MNELAERCFQSFDESKGYLTLADLKCAIAALLGFTPSKYEIRQWFASLSATETDQNVYLEEFVAVMVSKLSRRDNEDEIKCMFCALDFQGVGYITFPNLKKAFEEIGSDISPQVIYDIFREVDRDKDGRINYYEFYTIMTSAS